MAGVTTSYKKFNARPSHDPYVARSSHNPVERRAMALVYIVRWRCTTSCDLVRPSKIILRYSTMLGFSARLLNITNTPKTSGDDPLWLRRRATSHDYTRFTPDGPRSAKFTHRKSYGVVKASVTVALDVEAIIILLLHFPMNHYFIYLIALKLFLIHMRS